VTRIYIKQWLAGDRFSMLNVLCSMSNLNFSELLLALLLTSSYVLASEKCIYCRGISCRRTSYEADDQCSDKLDACVSVFQDGFIQAQGCLEGLEDDLREKCQEDNKVHGTDCEVCITEKCNKVAPKTYSCLQCNSAEVVVRIIKY